MFEFDITNNPITVLLDPKGFIVCQKNNFEFSNVQIQTVYKHSTSYNEKAFCITQVVKQIKKMEMQNLILLIAKQDENWEIRELAIKELIKLDENESGIKNEVISMFANEKNVQCRIALTELLSKFTYDNVTEQQMLGLYKSDSSQKIKLNALEYLIKNDKAEKYDYIISDYEKSDNPKHVLIVAQYYAEKSNEDKQQYFLTQLDKLSSINKFYLLLSYKNYVIAQMNAGYFDTFRKKCIELSNNNSNGIVKKYALYFLKECSNILAINKSLSDELNAAKQQIDISLTERLQNETDAELLMLKN